MDDDLDEYLTDTDLEEAYQEAQDRPFDELYIDWKIDEARMRSWAFYD